MNEEEKAIARVSLIRASRFFLALFSVVILFLAVVYNSPNSVGLRHLKSYCEKDAGLKIYRTVEASGYFNASGRTSLVHSSYTFSEYCDDAGLRYEPDPGPGCFRLTVVDRNSGQCHPGLDDRLSQFVVEPYPEFLASSCLAVEKVERPTARYSFHSDLQSYHLENKASKITRSRVYIKDTYDDSLLATYVTYVLNPKPGFSAGSTCHDLGSTYPSYRETNLVERVIKSK